LAKRNADQKISQGNKGVILRSMFLNKKGAEQIWWKLMTLLIAIVVLMVAVRIFFPGVLGVGDDIRGQFRSVQTDSDGDGFRDFQDDCPCTYGDLGNSGCPSDYELLEKAADQDSYNSDTECGKTNTDQSEVDVSSFEGGFEHYRSIEIFGDDDNGEVLGAGTGEIAQACVGMVGRECHSEDNDCDVDEFSYPKNSDYCLIMASEDDGILDPHDCGQASFGSGAIISQSGVASIKEYMVRGSYLSIDDEADPEGLFSWRWESSSEYGSLICSSGFWFGCKDGQEGRSLEVSGKNYVCNSGEWVKS